MFVVVKSCCFFFFFIDSDRICSATDVKHVYFYVSGTFSSVYVARWKVRDDIEQLLALKWIIPTSHPTRTQNEVRCLREIG